MRQVNDATLKLIESFEGLELSAYQDSVGVWTIGWGHTKGVKRGQKITRAQAEAFLREDLENAADGVEKALKVDVGDNEFGACVSLAFNIGVGAFAGSSIARNINRNKFQAAADSFLLWNKADHKVLAGLTRRRQAERKLFLTPDEEAHTLTTSPDNDPPATASSQTEQGAGSEAPSPSSQTIPAVPPMPAKVPGVLQKIGAWASGLSLTSIIGSLAVFKDHPEFLPLAVGLVKWLAGAGALVGGVVAICYYLERRHNATLANDINKTRLTLAADPTQGNVDFLGWKSPLTHDGQQGAQ
jgi:lysozyme